MRRPLWLLAGLLGLPGALPGALHAADPGVAIPSEAPDLQAEAEELRKRLASEQLRTAELEALVAELDRRVQAAAEPQVRPTEPDGPAAASTALPGWWPLALALALLVGVGLGAWLMDAAQRRRHGGFRV